MSTQSETLGDSIQRFCTETGATFEQVRDDSAMRRKYVAWLGQQRRSPEDRAQAMRQAREILDQTKADLKAKGLWRNES